MVALLACGPARGIHGMTEEPAQGRDFDLVVFGGTGDLAQRKLLPSLYFRDRDRQLGPCARILGLSRAELDDEAYRRQAEASLRRYLPAADLDEAVLGRFLGRLRHVRLDATSAREWAGLAEVLADGPDKVRVFYLATAPDLFGPICQQLGGAGLNGARSRVVLEKPIGFDLRSARAINDQVGSVFNEHQIFRIDHYLGKETVQNLMVLRFANALFEPLWNSSAIDHVQITVAETIGVEGRGEYYDRSGALRDMVQNHILQLLCLLAMEPPIRFEEDAVRDEKLKVLRALRPLVDRDVGSRSARGQYRAGFVEGAQVPGYAEESGTGRDSRTETFVALKAEIENWRWAGVPFYLRTGKRLPVRASEIVIQFRAIPHSIFHADAGRIDTNRLVVRLQPDEGIRLQLVSKVPGPGRLKVRRTALRLSFAETFKVRTPDAYERLLMDVVQGDPTLFMRRDEVEAAWAWIEPILAEWQRGDEPPHSYAAGTWGPSAAIALIERDGRTWHEDFG
jgi:glucose-6-phosphate 1-dehydrogenase